MTNKEIGEALNKLRKGKGYTLEELANLIGETKQHLSSIEKGTRSASEEKLNKVFGVFGYKINRVIKRIGVNKNKDLN